MDLQRATTNAGTRPPESTFVGDVLIDGYYRRPSPSSVAGARVIFAPSARTPWKVNPCGQSIVVVSGTAWAQSEGGRVVEAHAGDQLWFAPGERHWEGATPDEPMTYLAIQEEPGGRGVEFLAAVTDEEYAAGRTLDGCPPRRDPMD